MSAPQEFSIKETREQLSHLIDQVAIANREFVITKFGKPKAMLTPVKKSTIKRKTEVLPGFGAWRDRKDIKDSAQWVAKMRKQWSSRYEISS